MSDINNYLVLSEKRNALDNLIQSLVFLAHVEQNRFYLKWFIIAFHSAIYSFILLALQSIDTQQIYKFTVSSKQLGGKRKRTDKKKFDPFEDKLIDFHLAFKRLKRSQDMGGHPFMASKEQNECMKELNDKLRNQMIHFKPMAWGSEPWYPARVCLPLLDILRFCIELNSVRLEQSEKDTALAYIKSIEKLIDKHIV